MSNEVFAELMAVAVWQMKETVRRAANKVEIDLAFRQPLATEFGPQASEALGLMIFHGGTGWLRGLDVVRFVAICKTKGKYMLSYTFFCLDN